MKNEVIDALDRYQLPHSFVKVIPFSHEIEPDLELVNPVMIMGSVALANKVVPKKGWKPGAFINENFDFRVWRQHWSENILNEEAIVSSFDEVVFPRDGLFFIRPCIDNKAFTGTLLKPEGYQTWLERLQDGESSNELNFNLKEPVLVAPVKLISREIRFFIIKEKIITHSTYRLGGKTKYFDSSMTDAKAIQFVEERIKEWQPAEGFVIDVALTNDGYKVIEINCINSSGYYACDVYKIIMELENI